MAASQKSSADENSITYDEHRNNAISIAHFNYGTVSVDVAKFLKGHASRIRRYVGQSIITVGKDLLSAKHYLPHGAFIHWVEAEVGIPARSAQAYMQAAKWAEGKRAMVAHLPPALLYVLSASSTPTEFAADTLRRIEGGEQLTLSVVRAELKALRDEDRRTVTVDPAICPTEPSTRSADLNTDEGAQTMSVRLAIAILARALSTDDFKQVQEIMTHEAVLSDPLLPQSIHAAFSDITLSIFGEN